MTNVRRKPRITVQDSSNALCFSKQETMPQMIRASGYDAERVPHRKDSLGNVPKNEASQRPQGTEFVAQKLHQPRSLLPLMAPGPCGDVTSRRLNAA